MNKVECIKKLVSVGRACDVLEFVEGDSKYLSEASGGVPQSKELKRLWVLVVHHLRFVSEFGTLSTREEKNGKYLTPYPIEFEEWLSQGAPGIAHEDIERFIRDYPF